MEYDEYVKIYNEYYTELKDLCKENSSMLDKLSEERSISIDELKSSDIIFIDSGVKMLIPRFISKVRSLGVVSTTNNKPIFNERYVIPIKDWNGNIVNLVGYKKDADERYVYGTGEWYDRGNMIYGLENINEAYRMGWGILVEGISDTWALRQLGFNNTFGNCGTKFSDFKRNQLSRLRYGLIQIPDRDRAGIGLEKRTNIDKKVSLYVPIQYKDMAETIEKSDENYVSYIKDTIANISKWMLESGSLLSKYSERFNL